MKKILLSMLLVCASMMVFGQELNEYFIREQQFRKTGMTVLGSWAALNIAGGLLLRSNTSGSDRYFHEMNALWNTVNLGIATFGYVAAMRMATPADAFGLYKEQMSLDKTLLFNAGLDLAYIAGGLWAFERASNVSTNAERWRGYGRSIIMQGSFLFLFDVAMVLIHHKIDVSQGLQISFQPGAPDFLGLRYIF